MQKFTNILTNWRARPFKLIKGKNVTTSFLPLTERGGPVRHDKSVRYIPDKEQRCWTEDQARHVCKKVEMDKVINVETMKWDIEDDKMTRNRLNEEDTTETNPYQIVILSKVHKDDIRTEKMIHWSILSDLIKYIDGSLDMAPSLTVKPLDYRWHKILYHHLKTDKGLTVDIVKVQNIWYYISLL